jgi:hypothetical protein
MAQMDKVNPAATHVAQIYNASMHWDLLFLSTLSTRVHVCPSCTPPFSRAKCMNLVSDAWKMKLLELPMHTHLGLGCLVRRHHLHLKMNNAASILLTPDLVYNMAISTSSGVPSLSTIDSKRRTPTIEVPSKTCKQRTFREQVSWYHQPSHLEVRIPQ